MWVKLLCKDITCVVCDYSLHEEKRRKKICLGGCAQKNKNKVSWLLITSSIWTGNYVDVVDLLNHSILVIGRKLSKSGMNVSAASTTVSAALSADNVGFA